MLMYLKFIKLICTSKIIIIKPLYKNTFVKAIKSLQHIFHTFKNY